MDTNQIYTFVNLNDDYQDAFFPENEMIINFKNVEIPGEGSRS